MATVDEIDFWKFFRDLGGRLRQQRMKRKLTQEDMIAFGFSARHWQQVEAGRPITIKTLLRAAAVFETTAGQLLKGIDAQFVRHSKKRGKRS